jgi:DNA-binding beta-propeller fold protein YncE
MNRRHGWAILTTAAGLIALLGSATTTRADPLELVQTIVLKGKAGNLDHLALDAKRQRLFLANTANSTLDVIDLKDGKLLKQIGNQGGIQGVAHAPDLDRVFVGLGKDGFCNVFEGDDCKLVKTVKFEDDADNVRYDPRTHQAYVAHAEKSLGVLDGKTGEQKADIKLAGDAEGFQMETGRPRLYLNTPSPSQVTVIDTDKNEIVTTYPVKMAAENTPLALDEANHRLFLGCRKEPKVVVMDTETGKELSSADIAGEVDDLWFDAKRKQLYASCGDEVLVVLAQKDADHYTPLFRIQTPKGSKTSFFDPESGRLFLAVPRQEGKAGPEIRVYQAKP